MFIWGVMVKTEKDTEKKYQKQPKCKWCGTEFKYANIDLCYECEPYYRECKAILKNNIDKKTCLTCGNLFYPSKSLRKKDEWRKKFCSYICCMQSKKGNILKTCKHCGKNVYIDKKFKNAKNIFCTKTCKDMALNEQICKQCGQKFRHTKIVPLCPDCFDLKFITKCQNCGKPIKKNRKYIVSPKNYDILEDKIRFGKKRLQHRFIKSEMIYCNTKCAIEQERPYYYEGIGDEVYPIEFNELLKSKIRKRDSNQCQLCGAKWGLRIHHIDYNKENNTPTNLITLCLSCHPKTNYKRKQWVKLFSNYVIEWFGETIRRGL